ncbi:MAG: vitamin K epoxide reductase family protein [Dehalococcoidia bacterium]|nr:vitamin K epoxide reductase family protein [Dehalococcoidia bacterium]
MSGADVGAGAKQGRERTLRAATDWWGPPGVIAALSLIGIGVAGYLTYTHWLEESVACAGYSGCDAVAESEYARVSGVPVAFLGVLGYAAIMLTTLVWLRVGDRFGETPPLLVWGMALAGTTYSAYLTYLEFFVIEAVCIWCLASAAVMVGILLVATVAVVRARRQL